MSSKALCRAAIMERVSRANRNSSSVIVVKASKKHGDLFSYIHQRAIDITADTIPRH
jgi:hypothetical protein